MPARKWTPEQRARQAELIHKWKPWQQSTGAKTPEGKAVASKNALAYSLRETLRETNRTNRAVFVQMKEFFEYKAELAKQGITDEELLAIINSYKG